MRDSRLTPATALLLGIPLILFLGALVSDLAYYRTYNIQWINFAAWLNAGALVFGGLALLIGVIDFFRHRNGRGRPELFLLLVAGMWIAGFFGALVHGRDGWATMPAGLILSLITAVLAVAAAAVGLSGTRQVETR